MTREELQQLRGQTVVDVETAARALGVGRTLAYQLVRDTGQLCEGVRALSVGHLWRIPVKDLLKALGESPCHCEGGCHED